MPNPTPTDAVVRLAVRSDRLYSRKKSELMSTQHSTELVDSFEQFFKQYHDQRDAEDGNTDILDLAQRYPNEQKSLEVDWSDLFRFDPDLADDVLAEPEQLLRYAEEALRLYDLPIDVELGNAHLRVGGLSEDETFYPGEFSPTDHNGHYRSITGEVSKATDVYSKLEDAAFECELCGTLTRVPQSTGEFQEPHECSGCERQGPFRVNFPQSDFIDAQQLRIQTPPEIASGSGQTLDVFVEDDLADTVTIGDRVTISGIVCLEQKENGQKKTSQFEPYLDGRHIAVDETDHTDIDITDDERKKIREYANHKHGDPIELSAESLAPKIHGHELIKKMSILAMVGGSLIEYPNGDTDRGEFHMLLLGDPGTGKSKIIDRIEDVGWRGVGVSGKGAKQAGITAAAVQDDFGDGNWTLDAGAFVKANEGIVCIDELDDMPEDVRAAMLEPMSKQTIHINKAGINTRLQTRTAVVAAGNPKYGRFDPYEPVAQQFDLGSTLLSRFDLIYTLTDRPDEERDDDIATHILDTRDAAKRLANGEEVSDELEQKASPPVDSELLRKWIALAKQQPAPPFETEEVKQNLKDSFNTLRSVHGYDEDSPVPVTFRKLEGIVRIAEAAAKFEFSDTIKQRHARIATNAVGESMKDFGKNEDGDFDADVQETGESKSQKDRKKVLAETIKELDK